MNVQPLTDGRTDGRTDRRTDGRTDTQKFGGYNIMARHFLWRGIKMTHPFFHNASIMVLVGVFLTHWFETVGVFAHFLCVKNAKTPSIWSSANEITKS